MRAHPCAILPALAVVAIAGCGGGSSTGGPPAKRSTVDPKAYPAVARYFADDVTRDGAAPICDALAGVAGADRVAAVALDTCRAVRELGDERLRYTAVTVACSAEPACMADRGEPLLRGYLRRLRELVATYPRRLAQALEPGACLDALTRSEVDLEPSAVDAALAALPATMRRVRAGDPNAVRAISDLQFVNRRDARPCKP